MSFSRPLCISLRLPPSHSGSNRLHGPVVFSISLVEGKKGNRNENRGAKIVKIIIGVPVFHLHRFFIIDGILMCVHPSNGSEKLNLGDGGNKKLEKSEKGGK